MGERGKTRGWFLVGMTLILFGGAIYGVLMLLGVSFAIGTASAELGAPFWAIIAIPALVLIGFFVLIMKVIVDRITNQEDDYYSKHVDQ